jgi:amidase
MALWGQTARELARMFATGEATAREIVAAHLERIDEVNPGYNAVVDRVDDMALSAADAADAARRDGQPLGPLAGVPFTIKSNIDLAGSPTTFGLPIMKDAVPTLDAPVVERMKGAGAIPLARTNMPDLGLRMQTDSSLYGLTKNPWNAEHTTAGSSGGEAVALATGMSPIGLGNDLGGSLRNPASCVGVTSIKPSFGRVPTAEQISVLPNTIMSQELAVTGPMARTVDDVKLGLEILSGPHPRDPLAMPIPLEAKAGRKKVAVLATPPGGDTDPRVAAVVRDAAKALEGAGVIVEEVDMPAYEATCACWTDIVVGAIAAGYDAMAPVISDNAKAFMQNSIAGTGPHTPERWMQAWVDRFDLMVAWNQFFTGWDAVLTPTWTHPPLLVDADATNGPEGAKFSLDVARPVYPGNVLGLPSAAVPAGMVDGLPVGVLVTGPRWSDLTCLEIAKHVEEAGIGPDPLF